MKTAEEIINMLVPELANRLNKVVGSKKKKPDYYNEILGDTSFLLAGLLQRLLKKRSTDWDNNKWIDDSLLTNVDVREKDWIIEGVMIWGRNNTTEQWTAPFLFKISLTEDGSDYSGFTFLFFDLKNPEISYGEFCKNRDYWQLNPERDWKYIVHQTKA